MKHQDELRELVRRRMHGIEDQPTPEIVRHYAESHDLTRSTVKWLKLVMIRFGKWCGSNVSAADLRADRVNGWLTDMLDQGKLSRQTVKDYRRGLLIIWRWAYEEGLTDNPPLRVKKVKAPLPVPRAFTADQIVGLIDHASRLRGLYTCGIRRSLWFIALIRTAWDTGLRPCDLFQLRTADFNADGQGAIVQLKTGTTVFFTLRDTTMEAIEAIRQQERELVFGGVCARKNFYRALRRLMMTAGLTGGLKKIRKSAASAVERDQPGKAGRFLGHLTPGIAERHYLDPLIVNRERPRPPALGEIGGVA